MKNERKKKEKRETFEPFTILLMTWTHVSVAERSNSRFFGGKYEQLKTAKLHPPARLETKTKASKNSIIQTNRIICSTTLNLLTQHMFGLKKSELSKSKVTFMVCSLSLSLLLLNNHPDAGSIIE